MTNTNEKDIGTSDLNKLYCDCKNHRISGGSHPNNTYLNKTAKGIYVVTQIRKSKCIIL